MHKGSGYRSYERVDMLAPVEFPHTWPRQWVYANDIASISLDPFDERYDTVSGDAVLEDDLRVILWRWVVLLSGGGNLVIELRCSVPDGSGECTFDWYLENTSTGAWLSEVYGWSPPGVGYSPRRISWAMDELNPPLSQSFSPTDPFDIPGSWLAPIINSRQYH